MYIGVRQVINSLWSPDFDQLVKEGSLAMTLEIAIFISHTLSVPPVATTLRIRSDSPSTSDGGEEAQATH